MGSIRSRSDVPRRQHLMERTLVTTVVQYQPADDVQKAIDMGLKDGLASTLERLDELLRAEAASSGQAEKTRPFTSSRLLLRKPQMAKQIFVICP